MAAGLSTSEEFMVLFNRLKEAAGHTPDRVAVFFHQSQEIRDALAVLHAFIARSRLEHLSGSKVVRTRAAGFPAAWNEYNEKWRFRVTPDSWAMDLDHSVTLEMQYQEWYRRATIERIEQRGTPSPELLPPDLAEPDPSEIEDWLHQLMGDRDAAAEAYIAVEDYNRLVGLTGLDAPRVIQRWGKVPPVFLPPHVSNRYGASDKGSLPNLLEDAVRAYVFGAPAAAFAMCRAAFEMILKRHYGDGEWEDPREKLAKVMAVAEKRGLINREEIKPLIDRADGILHRYAQEDVLSQEDERTILIFLATLKSLVEQAPKH